MPGAACRVSWTQPAKAAQLCSELLSRHTRISEATEDTYFTKKSSNPMDQEEEKGVVVMSAQLGEGSSVINMDGSQVLGGDDNKGEKGKRSIEEEESLVATKSLKPSDEEIEANINSRLPPELLAAIFRFLPLGDLKRALLVCRWEQSDLGHSKIPSSDTAIKVAAFSPSSWK